MGAGKTIALLAVLGAVIGAVVASFVVPPALVWYNEPGAISPGKQVETVCNIPDVIRYATGRLLRGQLIGAGIGAPLFALVGFVLTRKRHPGAAEAA
jgi:hypothetical protein